MKLLSGVADSVLLVRVEILSKKVKNTRSRAPTVKILGWKGK